MECTFSCNNVEPKVFFLLANTTKEIKVLLKFFNLHLLLFKLIANRVLQVIHIDYVNFPTVIHNLGSIKNCTLGQILKSTDELAAQRLERRMMEEDLLRVNVLRELAVLCPGYQEQHVMEEGQIDPRAMTFWLQQLKSCVTTLFGKKHLRNLLRRMQ